jgi:hypothetical protein
MLESIKEDIVDEKIADEIYDYIDEFKLKNVFNKKIIPFEDSFIVYVNWGYEDTENCSNYLWNEEKKIIENYVFIIKEYRRASYKIKNGESYDIGVPCVKVTENDFDKVENKVIINKVIELLQQLVL